MLRSLLLVALLAQASFAQSVTMPQSVPVSIGRLASVTMRYDGEDFAYDVPPELDAFREYGTTPNEVKLRVIGYVNGTFRITAVTCKGGKLSPFQSCLVLVGGIAPPVPVPPNPTPVPPTPPDPTPAGPRGITIIRESADKTPAMARLETALRSGQQAQYLASKSHKLLILDDDSESGDGKPSPAVEAWRPIFSGMTLPVLIIYDPATRDVIAKQALPATAEAVVEAVRKAGG